MPTIHRILCATDLSSTSDAAWDQARRLGRLFDAEIVVVHVVPPPVVFPAEGYFPPQMYEELIQSARHEAETAFDRLLGGVVGSGLKVRIRLEDGAVAPRLLEVASEEAADLMVVGTHGRKGLERLLIGSVADRLLRQAACPILTVRPVPGKTSRAEIRRICYATDFSPTARAAWPWVVALASAAKADVDLVHVPFQPVVDRHLSAEALGRMAKILEAEGRIQVERFLAESTLPRERVHAHLLSGVPDEQIVHRAQSQDADLIVMGTHGWSGVVRWMLGSVARHVIETAPCPVLTVAPAGAARASAPARGDAR